VGCKRGPVALFMPARREMLNAQNAALIALFDLT
jgi:hypothetical protein